MTICIVRHGETVWNVEERKQGHLDSPLTLLGMEQAHIVASKIKIQCSQYNSSDIIASPLFRTRQYATMLCEILDIDRSVIKYDDRLKEHSFGLWEGLTDEEINNKFPGSQDDRIMNWWNYVVPGGESYQLLKDRLLPFVREIENKNVILVTHEMVSKVIRGIMLNLSNDNTLLLRHYQEDIFVL